MFSNWSLNSLWLLQDIVVFTNDVSRCAYYTSESQNVKERFYCQVDYEYMYQVTVTNMFKFTKNYKNVYNDKLGGILKLCVFTAINVPLLYGVLIPTSWDLDIHVRQSFGSKAPFYKSKNEIFRLNDDSSILRLRVRGPISEAPHTSNIGLTYRCAWFRTR